MWTTENKRFRKVNKNIINVDSKQQFINNINSNNNNKNRNNNLCSVLSHPMLSNYRSPFSSITSYTFLQSIFPLFLELPSASDHSIWTVNINDDNSNGNKNNVTSSAVKYVIFNKNIQTIQIFVRCLFCSYSIRLDFP